MQGSSFYHYTISEKGEAVLDKLSPEDEKLRTSGLSREQFEVLSNAGISNDQMQQYAKEHGFGSLKMTSIISLLDHRGYVKQKGLMKRKVVLTDEGRKVVALHSEI
jgi:predicted transcriptional regulator